MSFLNKSYIELYTVFMNNVNLINDYYICFYEKKVINLYLIFPNQILICLIFN
jgi:hypothetical protein